MNKENPDAAWTRSSLSKEYRRRGIKHKKVRPRYGFRKASQAALLVKDQQLMDELKKALACSPACRGEVIFIDEVTFSMKTFKPYAWSHTSQSVSQTTLLGSQPCQAVVGAASASRGLIVWHVSPKSFDA